MRRKPCPGCGADKPTNFLVCHQCWRRLPRVLSGAWIRARDRQKKLVAAHDILEHIRTAKKAEKDGDA